MDDDFDKESVRLREKQARCIHPSFVCTLCKLHKDNIKDEQRIEIEKLKHKIAQYEEILTQLGICFIKYEARSHNCIINISETNGKIDILERTDTTTP